MTDGWADSKEERQAGRWTGQRQVRSPRGSRFAYINRGGRKGGVQKVKRENLINVIGASPRRRAEIKLNEITVRSAETARESPLSAGGVLTRRARLPLILPHRCSWR